MNIQQIPFLLNMNSDSKAKFLAATSKRMLAESLSIKYSTLTYNLYQKKILTNYHEFDIRKRNGGLRHIAAPNNSLKGIQRKILFILQEIYPSKNCVHGYQKEKNIKSNALVHTNKKILLNIDLEEFFPSINFGRVLGLFKSFPFNFNSEVATLLAQMCCYNSTLPQGAPTSPVISNFICRRLDNAFIDLASIYKFDYTRYADDITISTNRIPLPKEIGIIENSELKLSNKILNIITSNGFKVNTRKVRYAFKNNRQEVTGLITNNDTVNVKRKYIRHVRAMLHSWQINGIEKASIEHFEKYNIKFKTPAIKELAFQNELIGKIGFIGNIRGKNDGIYINLANKVKELSPQVNFSIIQKVADESELPILLGEGKTDWKHLKAALEFLQSKGKFGDLKIRIKEYTDGFEINNAELLRNTISLSKMHFYKSKIISIFDRDDLGTNKKISPNNERFKYWGNNVYSLLLPIPKNRAFKEICIEHYYNDEDLFKQDNKKRRIFLSTEFDPQTGMQIGGNLTGINKKILKSHYPKILDQRVCDDGGDNFALSKNDFANYILNKVEPFDNVSFENFEDFFNVIREIVNHEG